MNPHTQHPTVRVWFRWSNRWSSTPRKVHETPLDLPRPLVAKREGLAGLALAAAAFRGDGLELHDVRDDCGRGLHCWQPEDAADPALAPLTFAGFTWSHERFDGASWTDVPLTGLVYAHADALVAAMDQVHAAAAREGVELFNVEAHGRYLWEDPLHRSTAAE